MLHRDRDAGKPRKLEVFTILGHTHGITLVVGNGSVQVSMSATAFDSMDGMVRRLKAKSLRPRTGGLRGTQVGMDIFLSNFHQLRLPLATSISSQDGVGSHI